MLIPISWLKDFVEIKFPLKDLMWKMTEAGLTCESYKKVGDEIILNVEVTANRPDWMSIIGVAREVAAIQGLKLKKAKEINLPKKAANFPIDLVPNFNLFERWTGIVIKGVKIAPSPKWIQERIKFMGHSPINNIIDITNYVMYELGIPMHAFDYDDIFGQIMTPQLAKGGEDFTSVDNLNYRLPKNAIIIKDAKRIIDLAGIKGGLNSGIRDAQSDKDATKNIFLHVTINNPVLVRRASQALGLRSEASAIYERGPDKGGVTDAIKRALSLILETAGGEIASELVDLKKERFEPWELTLTFDKLNQILGIKIDPKEVVRILAILNLAPKKSVKGVDCTIPTYRADLKIEEDLVEEVARIYGYNKFPRTIPIGQVAAAKIPYYFDDSFILNLKNLMTSSGFSEVMTLSLVSSQILDMFEIKKENCAKIINPVSLDYEYMRPTLIPGLITGTKMNTEERVKLFETDKIYPGESYKLSGVTKGVSFREFKGAIDLIFEKLNIKELEIEFDSDKPYFHPSKAGIIKMGGDIIGEFGGISPKILSGLEIKEDIFAFEFDIASLQKHERLKRFRVVPENPPQVEDLTLIFPEKTRIGEVIRQITNHQPLITNIELRDIFRDSYTFRIWYQDPKKTLTNLEVEKIRKSILQKVKGKFGGQTKV